MAVIVILPLLALLCLATILFESLPVLFVKKKRAWWKASLICNIVTNPILNMLVFLLTAIVPQDILMGVLLLLELAVVLTEAYFYRKMLDAPAIGCFLYSLIANALSYSIGIFLLHL